ncbi:MAG: peptidase S8/S53 subtilisin kexin, partial [Geobacteraceae bacterium]
MNSMPGQPITPAVAVSFMDQYGNVATGSTADVTLAIASGSHSGILSGTTTRPAVNGIATFTDLAIGPEGNGYMLTATGGSLPPVNSASFDVIIGTCGKPASLTIPATNSTGTISIIWSASDVSGATYILEQSKDGGAFTEVYSGTNISASIIVTASGTYTYRVKAAKDGYITSGYTVGSTGCVVQLTCPAPASLTVPATNSTGTISITWSASDVSGATYIIEQSKDGGAFTEAYSGTNTFANIAVTANGTYAYRVKAAKDGYFASGYTLGSTGCVVHLACGKPASLTVPATNSTGTFYLTWSASDVSGATYILEQSKDGGTFTEVYSGTNTFANIAVTANGTYIYRVKALKTNYDTSDYTVGSTGCVVHLACGAPASLTVPAANSTGTFYVTWSASDVSGATYVVEQSKDGGAFTEVYSGTNTFANIAVTANGTYTYRVKALKTNYDTSDYTVGSTGCVVHLACGAPA